MIELAAPRSYTTSNIIQNSLPLAGMDLTRCISMCSTMAGCYAMNWYDDQMCMLLLNKPSFVNDRPCKIKYEIFIILDARKYNFEFSLPGTI